MKICAFYLMDEAFMPTRVATKPGILDHVRALATLIATMLPATVASTLYVYMNKWGNLGIIIVSIAARLSLLVIMVGFSGMVLNTANWRALRELIVLEIIAMIGVELLVSPTAIETGNIDQSLLSNLVEATPTSAIRAFSAWLGYVLLKQTGRVESGLGLLHYAVASGGIVGSLSNMQSAIRSARVIRKLYGSDRTLAHILMAGTISPMLAHASAALVGCAFVALPAAGLSPRRAIFTLCSFITAWMLLCLYEVLEFLSFGSDSWQAFAPLIWGLMSATLGVIATRPLLK